MAAVTNSSCAIWRLVRPVRGELGDALLGRGQRVGALEREPARAGAGGEQLGAGAVGERARARGVRAVHAEAQRLARLGALVRAAQRGAELDPRAGQLEPVLGRFEQLDGVPRAPACRR